MANDSNPFNDLSKMMNQFKVPGVDMAPIIESRRKDMEALTEANKAVFAGMQALAQKQAEILTQAMQGMQAFAKGATAPGAVTSDIAKHTELVRGAYEKALADMKDLAEIARKTQSDAMANITKRATQSMEEMKKLNQPK